MQSLLNTAYWYLAHGETLGPLGDQLGMDQLRTAHLVTPTCSLLLGGLADRAERFGGTARLSVLLDEAARLTHQGVDSVIHSEPETGAAMLRSIFGAAPLEAVTRQLASYAGIDATTAAALLARLTPMVLWVVAEQRRSEHLNDAGLKQRLHAERKQLRHRQLPLPVPVPGQGPIRAEFGSTIDDAMLRWLVPVGLAVASVLAWSAAVASAF